MQRSTGLQIMLQIISLLFIAGAVGLSSLPLHASDDSEYTFQSDVNEVRLAFAAFDRQGRIVKSLRAADVAVVDNGTIIRNFRSFGPASESPLDLVILVDVSDSIAAQMPQEIAEVRSFVGSSKWGARDKVSILTFGGIRSELVCAENCNTRSAQVKLNSLHTEGTTPLYDALIEAAEILKQRDPELRPALIVFSDGMDTISRHSAMDVIGAVQDLQSAIYSVNERPAKSGPGRGDEVLQYLAASTGGLSFAPGKKVEEILRTIMEDLRGGYVLTYELPEQTSGQHTVRILPVSDPTLDFRSRRAYDNPAQ